MTVACAAAALGQILLRHGMQQVGPLETWQPWAVVSFLGRAITNPSVVLGTVLNAVFYLFFLAALSWTEVTVVLPLTALEYLFAAVLSVLILKETVPGRRWLGIALVIGGVILVGLSESAPGQAAGRTGTSERSSSNVHPG
jgi:undecaprenyl phosphate-alpha-L-ara4N flippase subunit ArnE